MISRQVDMLLSQERRTRENWGRRRRRMPESSLLDHALGMSTLCLESPVSLSVIFEIRFHIEKIFSLLSPSARLGEVMQSSFASLPSSEYILPPLLTTPSIIVPQQRQQGQREKDHGHFHSSYDMRGRKSIIICTDWSLSTVHFRTPQAEAKHLSFLCLHASNPRPRKSASGAP